MVVEKISMKGGGVWGAAGLGVRMPMAGEENDGFDGDVPEGEFDGEADLVGEEGFEVGEGVFERAGLGDDDVAGEGEVHGRKVGSEFDILGVEVEDAGEEY